MRALIHPLALLVGIALLAALLNAVLNPRTPGFAASHPEADRVTLAETLTSDQPETATSNEPSEADVADQAATTLGVTDSVLWVDARTVEEFSEGHVPGAIHLSEDNWDAGFLDLIERWTPGQQIVVYCGAEDCQSSRAVALRLRRELGTEDVHYLAEGWEGWLEAQGS